MLSIPSHGSTLRLSLSAPPLNILKISPDTHHYHAVCLASPPSLRWDPIVDVSAALLSRRSS